jgi:hypothetical protein
MPKGKEKKCVVHTGEHGGKYTLHRSKKGGTHRVYK